MNTLFVFRELKAVVSLQKGTPPVEQPYFGHDAELYLTPEYLRGGAGTEPIKAGRRAARVTDGDTLILWDGSNAGEVLKGRAGVLASTMTRLRPQDSFNSQYFYYAVKRWESFLKGQTSGSGIPHVDKEVLGRLTVVEFAEREQAMIAAILSTVDQAIEETEALIAKRQRIARGMMMDLLTRGIDCDGKLRSEKSHKLKDSVWGKIPVEWDVIETRQACCLITKGTTPRVRSTESHRFCVPYLRVQNLTFSGELELSDLAFVDHATQRGELCRSKVVPGDVLQNIVGPPLGKVAIVPNDYDEWNINQAIALFRPNGCVLSTFLAHWLRYPATRSWFEIRSKKTSGQKNLTLEHCQELPMLLPPLDEQSRICLALDAAANCQRVGLAQLQKLRSLRTALMQDLLTGRKPVMRLLTADHRSPQNGS